MFNKVLLFVLVMVSVAKANMGVEVDPVAYGLNGYSGHLIYNTDLKFNADIGFFAMQFPEFAEPNKGFQSKFNGYGIKLNYQDKTISRFFAGINYGKSQFTIEQTSTAVTKTADIQTLGLQFGYQFGNDGFYIKPWIGFDKLLNRPKLNFNSGEYNFPEINIFPTVHLGYSF
ncbi:MAG: hypothetical protein ACXVCL_13020 [Bdellovibrio sp.]